MAALKSGGRARQWLGKAVAGVVAGVLCVMWVSSSVDMMGTSEAALMQSGSNPGEIRFSSLTLLNRRQMNSMSLRKLEDDHEMLEKRLATVRERLENRRLEHKVIALQQAVDDLRQRAALASGNGGLVSNPMLRSVEYKQPWTRSIGQDFVDDDNALNNAKPADKVMDPDERPFLRSELCEHF